jgi:hypothetical protein
MTVTIVHDAVVTIQKPCPTGCQIAFDEEHNMNYVLCMFYTEGNMIRAVVEEAAALVSIALFIGMIAIWAEVLSSGL